MAINYIAEEQVIYGDHIHYISFQNGKVEYAKGTIQGSYFDYKGIYSIKRNQLCLTFTHNRELATKKHIATFHTEPRFTIEKGYWKFIGSRNKIRHCDKKLTLFFDQKLSEMTGKEMIFYHVIPRPEKELLLLELAKICAEKITAS